MELTPKHRRACLDELDTAQKEIEHMKRCIECDEAKKDEHIRAAFEIKHHFAMRWVQEIREALVTNEIDY